MQTKRKSPSRESEADELDVASSVLNNDYADLENGPPHEPVAKILTTRSGALFLPIAVKRLPEDQLETLADLQHLALARQQALISIEEVIVVARNQGLSWNVIGWSIGMSGQAARKRWLDLDENR